VSCLFFPHQYAGMSDHAVVMGGRSLAGEQMAPSTPNWAAGLAYRRRRCSRAAGWSKDCHGSFYSSQNDKASMHSSVNTKQAAGVHTPEATPLLIT
jgi:hypothetical protein